MGLTRKNNVLIITQPEYPVPPVNDGAQSIVINDTVRHIDSSLYTVISLYSPKLNGVFFDKHKFHIVNNHKFIFRAVRKILVAVKRLHYINSTRYADLLVGIYLLSLRKPIDTLVVHSTKMNWLIELKRWFPRVKVISYHHSSEDQNCPSDVLKKVIEQIDAHIFVSRFGEEAFKIKAEEALPGKRLETRTIQNGINLNQFKTYPNERIGWKNKYGLLEERVTLLFAGRIIPRKGLHLLLEALQQLDEEISDRVQLVISGGADFFKNDPTPYVCEVKDKILELRSKMHIVELGYTPHKEVHELFAVADIFLFTSIEPEGSPLSLIEALASGLPVITSGIGGISEIVDHGVTGFILDTPLQASQLKDGIFRMVNDTQLRMELKENAIRLSHKKFSSQRMVNDFTNAMNLIN